VEKGKRAKINGYVRELFNIGRRVHLTGIVQGREKKTEKKRRVKTNAGARP